MNLKMPQLSTDMIQIADKEIVITLMYSQSSQKILFVEAEKEFVDLLVGFLTLPIGCAIKLLFDNALVTPKTVGAISNVFKSVQRLEAEETHKKVLTDRKPGYGLRCLAIEGEIGLLRESISNSQDYYT